MELLTAFFFDCRDFYNLKPESQIAHDKKVKANPIQLYQGLCLDEGSCVIDSKGNLWRYAHLINIVCNIISSDETGSVLNLQDFIEEKTIIVNDEIFHDCKIGEIEVECLVKFRESEYYSPCSHNFFDHKPSKYISMGDIVALRFLNLEELLPKYKFRNKTLRQDWYLFLG